ncbi:MAG: hypothetical protein ACD_75C01367G0009 [uncultured bacterium]|nr:MAG: hypothetical protein ACD_75C01367G0009 [uncultured bacterium]
MDGPGYLLGGKIFTFQHIRHVAGQDIAVAAAPDAMQHQPVNLDIIISCDFQDNFTVGYNPRQAFTAIGRGHLRRRKIHHRRLLIFSQGYHHPLTFCRLADGVIRYGMDGERLFRLYLIDGLIDITEGR